MEQARQVTPPAPPPGSAEPFSRDGVAAVTTECHEASAAGSAPAALEGLLLDWQNTADPACLEQLVAAARPLAEEVAAASLSRRGIHDLSAIDEAVCLVLDHLRRLPGAAEHGRHVAPFAPRINGDHRDPASDSGRGYLIRLSCDRALDVARGHHRRSRHGPVFSQLERPDAHRLRDHAAAETSEPALASLAGLCDRLYEAVPRLPPRERLVVELLLEGKSQAVIAHLLEVCEGTVSRLRARAILHLRDLLADRPAD